MRDNIKNQAKLAEAIDAFKRTDLGPELFKLKTIWVPDGFDPDDERARETMSAVLRSAIVEDILFNVVFGHLSARAVAVFLSAHGREGLQLALLTHIAQHTIGNIRQATEALDVSAASVRERLLILQSAGFVGGPGGLPGYSIMNEVTPRGRVFLDLLRRIDHLAAYELALDDFSPELTYILGKLDLAPEEAVEYDVSSGVLSVSAPALLRLLNVIAAAEQDWGVDFQRLSYTTLVEAGKVPPGLQP